jgi:hypothetical protein
VVIRTQIVSAEVSVDKGVVRWLIVDPKEKELLGLEAGLKFKSDLPEGNSVGGKGFWFGCNGSRESAHLALVVVLRVFMAERGLLRWNCLTKSEAWT